MNQQSTNSEALLNNSDACYSNTAEDKTQPDKPTTSKDTWINFEKCMNTCGLSDIEDTWIKFKKYINTCCQSDTEEKNLEGNYSPPLQSSNNAAAPVITAQTMQRDVRVQSSTQNPTPSGSLQIVPHFQISP